LATKKIKHIAGPCERAFACLTLRPPAMMMVGEFVVS
jgi:hypothetical protein